MNYSKLSSGSQCRQKSAQKKKVVVDIRLQLYKIDLTLNPFSKQNHKCWIFRQNANFQTFKANKPTSKLRI